MTKIMTFMSYVLTIIFCIRGDLNMEILLGVTTLVGMIIIHDERN